MLVQFLMPIALLMGSQVARERSRAYFCQSFAEKKRRETEKGRFENADLLRTRKCLKMLALVLPACSSQQRHWCCSQRQRAFSQTNRFTENSLNTSSTILRHRGWRTHHGNHCLQVYNNGIADHKGSSSVAHYERQQPKNDSNNFYFTLARNFDGLTWIC